MTKNKEEVEVCIDRIGVVTKACAMELSYFGFELLVKGGQLNNQSMSGTFTFDDYKRPMIQSYLKAVEALSPIA